MASDPLALELGVVVSHTLWVLRLRSSARTAPHSPLSILLVKQGNKRCVQCLTQCVAYSKG